MTRALALVVATLVLGMQALLREERRALAREAYLEPTPRLPVGSA